MISGLEADVAVRSHGKEVGAEEVGSREARENVGVVQSGGRKRTVRRSCSIRRILDFMVENYGAMI